MQQGSEIVSSLKNCFNKIKHSGFIVVLVIIMASLFSLQANAQYALKQAREEDSLYNYAKAIPLYEKAYNKKPTAEAARGLSRAYYRQRKFFDAISWYAKLLSLPDHTKMDEFYYAKILMGTRQYPEAKELLLKLDTSQLTVSPVIVKNMIAGCDSAIYWMANPVKGNFSNLEKVNTPQSDWDPVLYKGNIIFASSRPIKLKKKEPFFRNTNLNPVTYGWTGDSYQHIYAIKENDSTGIHVLDTATVRDFYHAASTSFTADGKQMFFALTRYTKKKGKFIGKDNPYTIHLEIYCTYWDSSKNNWKEPVKFPYNDILNNSVGDPFISAGGDTLYFVSDAPFNNSHGGTDIYYSTRTGDTSWAMPVNMGDSINTPGNERTPYFDSAGNMYFSSDGHIGMGGLDIFKAKPDGNGAWQVRNAGVPVNSPQDDFTPLFAKNYKGYFASNRLLGKGSDDIYQFAPAIIFRLEGEVLHVKTHEPIAGATVTLTNLTNHTPATVTTSYDGKFAYPLDSATAYKLSAEKAGLSPSAIEDASTIGLEESTVIYKTLYLDSIPKPEPIAIVPIYYDFDKSFIRKDAINPLDHIVALMKEHPDWKVDIGSHTDSRGTDAYNMRLSDRRAKAAVEYLINHGITPDRITAEGFGETRLVNGCSNGVPCSKEEHQLNRRSEFKFENQ